MNEARIGSAGRLVFWIIALIVAAGGCHWNPRMVHPNTFTSGRTLPARKVEIAGQIFPGASVAVGLGRGFETHLGYCLVGEDVNGVELQLTRTVWHRGQFYLSSTAAGERFIANAPHDFDGWRTSFGGTFSRYNKEGWFGFHLPVRAYYMEYDWTDGFDEHGSFSGYEDWSGTGWVVTFGASVSFEQPNWAIKFGFNGPIPDSVNQIEMYPYWALQAAFRF